MWLGHHSAAFTLATYVHLLPDEIAAPLSIESEPSAGTVFDAHLDHVGHASVV